MTKHKQLRIYTDGGARGNPGPAASGAVLKWLTGGREGEIVARVSRYLGHTTNNQAEYTAIIIGLEKAQELHAAEVEVYLDSELAARQLTGVYRVKNPEIAKRFLEVQELSEEFDEVTFHHIPREKNKEADAVVNQCIDAHTGKSVL